MLKALTIQCGEGFCVAVDFPFQVLRFWAVREPPHFVSGSQDCHYPPAGVFAYCANQQLEII
jgi:hypothetical protein